MAPPPMTGESGDPGSEADVPTFVICVENNKFQPENWWNGRWRSEFSLSLGRTKITFLPVAFCSPEIQFGAQLKCLDLVDLVHLRYKVH